MTCEHLIIECGEDNKYRCKDCGMLVKTCGNCIHAELSTLGFKCYKGTGKDFVEFHPYNYCCKNCETKEQSVWLDKKLRKIERKDWEEKNILDPPRRILNEVHTFG